MQLKVRLTLISLALHAPGLRILGKCRINRRTRILNALAVVGTLAAMGYFAIEGHRWSAVFYSWLIGHVLWSVCLAALVYLGLAIE
jgi:hypothetical protein